MYRSIDEITAVFFFIRQRTPDRHSRNKAILRVFCVRGVIICLRAIPCIVERLRAVTGYSESVILSDMVGTSRHTATIRPTEQEHPTLTPERALMYRSIDEILLFFLLLVSLWRFEGVRGNLTRKRFCQYIVRTKSLLATSVGGLFFCGIVHKLCG